MIYSKLMNNFKPKTKGAPAPFIGENLRHIKTSTMTIILKMTGDYHPLLSPPILPQPVSLSLHCLDVQLVARQFHCLNVQLVSGQTTKLFCYIVNGETILMFAVQLF